MHEELVKALRETRESVRRHPDVAMYVPPYQLSAAADVIEKLQSPTPVRCRDCCHWARDDWGDEYTPPSMECEKDDCFESLNLDPCYGERDDVDVPDCPFYLNQEQIEQMVADYHVYEPHYKVVTLCGSTRFKDAFMEAQKRLTLDGNIVISVGLFGHSGDDEVWTEGTKEMLDDMHKRKIDMADEIFVINPGGYIGSSTRSEIDYAKANGKKVVYMEPPEEKT